MMISIPKLLGEKTKRFSITKADNPPLTKKLKTGRIGSNSNRRKSRITGVRNAQSFTMAYRSGTGQANFSGSGYSVEAGNVNISGTSHHQTQLAGMTAPPSRPKPFLLAIITTFVVPFFSLLPLLIAYLTSPAKFAFILLIDGALIAAAYVLCAAFAPPQRKRYREKYELWERAWICLRCGHSFDIK
jgi:hypothetical protein